MVFETLFSAEKRKVINRETSGDDKKSNIQRISNQESRMASFRDKILDYGAQKGPWR